MTEDIVTGQPGRQGDIGIGWTCAVLHRSTLVKRFVDLTPAVRGGWVVAPLIVRFLPPAARRVNVWLSGPVGGVLVAFDLSDPVQFAMVRNDQFDLGTVSIVGTLLRLGDTFIDVGANWGYFTALASQIVGSEGLVVALEPNREAYRQLQETIHRNGLANVIAASYAAYSDEGLRVSIRRPFYRQTTSSYVREGAFQGMGDTVTNTLDRLWKHIGKRSVRLLKIDTEGAELPVLKGAREILGDMRPWVIAEVSAYSRRFGYTASELYAFMASFGYTRAHLVSDRAVAPGIIGTASEGHEGQILFQPNGQEIALPRVQDTVVP